MSSVAVVGTFDTKGPENLFLIQRLEAFGLEVISINMGRHTSSFPPTYSSTDVAFAAGASMESLSFRERGECLDTMRRGAAKLVRSLITNGTLDGIIAIGGGQGTWMASHVFKAVPIGIPKVLVSTLATIGRCQDKLEGIKDTFVINSLVDVSGLNPVLCTILENSACALAGMVLHRSNRLGTKTTKKRIGISMWGVTTPCVQQIQKILAASGKYEVYVFHATGMGGSIMDSLIKQHFFHGTAEITLPEITIAMAGGTYPENAERLRASAAAQIPQIIVPGGVDMIETTLPIPEKFQGRAIYMHNSDLAFVRSTDEENELFAREIADRINETSAPATVLLPLRGLSANDREGNIFHDQKANETLFNTLKASLHSDITVVEVDAHINDKKFAELTAQQIMLTI